MKKKRQQKQRNLPVVLLVTAGILLVLASALLFQNQTSPPPSQVPDSGGHEEESYPEIARVSVEDAKAALDTGTAIFVDVRGDQAYAAAHVAGSVSLPLTEIETRLAELDPKQWIITYCT